jgi:hypothetical protein
MNHDVEALKTFLDQQPEKPRLHINGGDFPFAILSVDYGQPLSGVLISSERGIDPRQLRQLARRVLRLDGVVSHSRQVPLDNPE